MPWAIAAGVVGIAGVVAGAIGAHDAAGNQGDAIDAQSAAMRDQTALGREQLDWNKEQYGKWEDRFDPIFSDMMSEIDQDLEPNYGMIAGDVSSAFQSQRGQERRNMMRYGVRPQDGSFAGADRQYGIREAAAHVGARSQARESKRGLKYNRLASVTGMGYGVQPSIIGGVNQAAGNLGNMYGNQATQHGNIASMWGTRRRRTPTAQQVLSAAWIGKACGTAPRAGSTKALLRPCLVQQSREAGGRHRSSTMV